MRAIAALPAPWGSSGVKWPAAADAGTQPSTIVSLSKILGKGVTGRLVYANRKYLPDKAVADDFLTMEFQPDRVDYASFVDSGLMCYVRALGAYVGTIKDESLMRKHFNAWQRAGIDYRDGVFRIQAVNFFDRLLCRRAFGLTPGAVVRRVKKHVERAVVEENGALIVVKAAAIPPAEADRIERQIRPLLGK